MNSPPVLLPTIPETIVVHLGSQDEEAPNIEVGFIDYIANVASHELYPTWPESALIANMIAQITFALNRVYTEYYRSRGYNFDITATPQMDQTYDQGGSVYENLEKIAEEYFNSYIRREGSVAPLFAAYCDGINTLCQGLSQTGSVELANQGFTPLEILRYYYGEDLEFVPNVSISTPEDTAPDTLLRLGSSGNSVYILQRRLNRISANYPSIPKIYPEDGIFGVETQSAVREFQKVFGLTVDGIVGDATWFEVREKFNAVKKLNELLSEGLTYEEVTLQFPENLSFGDRGVYVSIIQYYLNFVSAFTTEYDDIPITGVYDEETVQQVKDFQTYAGLVPSGVMDEETWNVLYDEYRGIILSLPPSSFEGIARPFPGIPLRVGSTGKDVRDLQEYINVLAGVYEEVPVIAVDGIFGNETRDAVYAIQALFNLTLDGSVDSITWAKIADEYNTILAGGTRADDQFPGYTVTQESEN